MCVLRVAAPLNRVIGRERKERKRRGKGKERKRGGKEGEKGREERGEEKGKGKGHGSLTRKTCRVLQVERVMREWRTWHARAQSKFMPGPTGQNRDTRTQDPA